MPLKIPANLQYTETHQWLRMDNGIATVGITDYGLPNGASISGIELPQRGSKIEKGSTLATIASSKGPVEVSSPVSGKIIEVNGALTTQPGLCITYPYGKGWIAKIKPGVFLDTLMTPEEYADIYNKI